MKGFLKFIGVVGAIFTAVLAALAVADKFLNKNRLEDDYLECNVEENA